VGDWHLLLNLDQIGYYDTLRAMVTSGSGSFFLFVSSADVIGHYYEFQASERTGVADLLLGSEGDFYGWIGAFTWQPRKLPRQSSPLMFVITEPGTGVSGDGGGSGDGHGDGHGDGGMGGNSGGTEAGRGDPVYVFRMEGNNVLYAAFYHHQTGDAPTP